MKILPLLIFLPGFCFADTDFLSKEDVRLLNSKSGGLVPIYVSAKIASIYSEQSESGVPIWTLDWAKEFVIDRDRMPSAKAGWLPISSRRIVVQNTGTGANEWKSLHAGWIRRRDVVLPGDFKDVIGCWPVKHITFTAGDFEVEIDFASDGTGWAIDNSGHPEKRVKMKTKVSMANGIAEVSAVAPYNRQFFIAGYSASERRLYPHGTLNNIQQFTFPEPEFSDCKGMPKVKN